MNNNKNNVPIVDILINGEKRKYYGKNKNKLYLNDGQEFQIRLENPTNENIGVVIKFNSEKESNDILVLKPKEKFVLDRFLNTKKKLIFKTYDIVGETKNVEKEVKKNGVVVVEFYSEYIYPAHKTHINSGTSGYSGNSIGIIGTSGKGKVDDNSDLLKNDTTKAKLNISSFKNIHSDLFTSDACYVDDVNIDINNVSNNNNFYGTKTIFDNLLAETTVYNLSDHHVIAEVGKIEEGEKSKQKFEKTTFKPGKLIYKTKFKLLPMSAKEKEQIKKIDKIELTEEGIKYVTYTTNSQQLRQYCENCGYRIRNNSWKFCPLCGDKY